MALLLEMRASMREHKALDYDFAARGFVKDDGDDDF